MRRVLVTFVFMAVMTFGPPVLAKPRATPAAKTPAPAAEDSLPPDIPIVATLREDDFPLDWRKAQDFHCEPFRDPRHASDLAGALRGEFSKYPDAMVTAHLRQIDLFVILNIYGGHPIGGCYYKTPKTILLQAAPRPYTLRAFHHEFSSLLLLDHFELFEYDEWIATLPPGFKYWYAIDGPRHWGMGTFPTDVMAADGFASDYGTDSLENDFNMIAQNLFLPYPGFWDRVDRYVALKKKVRLAIDFYHALDPRFTEAYFRKFDGTEPLPPGDLEKSGEPTSRKRPMGAGKNPLWSLDPTK